MFKTILGDFLFDEYITNLILCCFGIQHSAESNEQCVCNAFYINAVFTKNPKTLKKHTKKRNK